MQELSFDTLKSIKGQEIVVPATLQMVLPQDYVSYTKILSMHFQRKLFSRLRRGDFRYTKILFSAFYDYFCRASGEAILGTLKY